MCFLGDPKKKLTLKLELCKLKLLSMWRYLTSINISDLNTPKYQKNVILPKQARLKRMTSI